MNDKLEKLNKLLELTQNDTITPKQVEKFLGVVLEVIKKSKDNLEQLTKEQLATINISVAYIENYCSSMMDSMESKSKSTIEKLDKKLSDATDLIKEVKKIKAVMDSMESKSKSTIEKLDKKLSDALDKKLSDATDLIKEVKKIKKDGLNGSPDTAEEIKIKLEGLKDDNRLDISAIKGTDIFSTKVNLDRAISILDQRTQFLINKQTNQSSDLGGYVPTSRTLTINGTSYDLSADRSWTVTGTSQWTTVGSDIYYNTGKVAIGTTTFSKDFNVTGASYFDGYLGIGSTTGAGAEGSIMRIAADNGVTGGGQLILTGKTDPNKQIIFGYNTTGGYGQFQAVHQGVATKHIALNPASGNVSINQATNTYALDVFSNAGPCLGGMIRIKDSDPTSFAGFKMDNSNGHGGNFFKVGPSYSGYKTIGANDFGIYNGNNSGNMTFINDYASGNITFTAGGASTAHMTITATGNVGIGGSATSTSRVNIQGLPTSSAGLSSGDLWNDTGTIKIV